MESLNVKTKAGCAAVMTAASLFAQWAHWFIFEKIEFSSFYLFFTPLVLCFMYRLLMADSENGGRFSKPFIFIFTVALPLAAAFIISAFMLLNYPDKHVFSGQAGKRHTLRADCSLFGQNIYNLCLSSGLFGH